MILCPQIQNIVFKNPVNCQTHAPKEVHDKPPLTIEQLREIFKRYDTDNDGQLSEEELKSAFRYLGSHFSYYRAVMARFYADSDKDGCINLKNDEFSALVSYAHSCGYKVKTCYNFA